MGISSRVSVPRLPLLGALAIVPLALATGCGSEATGARTTLATVQNTSYVVEDPVPTTVPPTTQPISGGATEGQIDPNEQQYTVASGDSVSKIASLFGIEATVLANYNAWPEGIQHPIFPGDIIKIPPNSKVPGTGSPDTGSTGGDTGSTDTTPDATQAPEDSVASGEIACEHTVVENDNPSRLAEQYGVSLDELSNANVGNPAYTRFLIGDKINIPAGGDC
jgi:LysM repeat protein